MPNGQHVAALDGRCRKCRGAPSMPYSVLAGSLPAEHTVYIKIFFFNVLPEIIASLGFVGS